MDIKSNKLKKKRMSYRKRQIERNKRFREDCQRQVRLIGEKYAAVKDSDDVEDVIPNYYVKDVNDLIEFFLQRLSEEKNMIDTDACSRILIVGDIHGDIKSFLKIVHYGLDDPNCAFVFLGNYINRGVSSVQVLIYMMLLKVAYPNRFYFLKGNHETEDKWATFKSQWEARYVDYDPIVTVFNTLKYFYILEDGSKENNGERYFCVHGCIPKNRFFQMRVNEISELDRSLNDYANASDHIDLYADVYLKKKIERQSRLNYFDYERELNEVCSDFLWSEPFFSSNDYNTKDECKNYTKNGKGNFYGKRVVKDFCEQYNITGIFKGGLPMYHLTPDKRVLNVFSSCDYCGFNIDGYFIEMRLIKTEKRSYDFKRIQINSLNSSQIEISQVLELDGNHCSIDSVSKSEEITKDSDKIEPSKSKWNPITMGENKSNPVAPPTCSKSVLLTTVLESP